MARGRRGRLSLCESAVKPFWCSRIPAASCSANCSARRWKWDVSCASPSALPRPLARCTSADSSTRTSSLPIFWSNAASGEVRLTGFGIASRLPRERQPPDPPEVIAGTLAYMAPEQTGRMNRSIDSRSDLYSLGVTFYQMLTGTFPFTASDPMEWVHCHIARQACAPGERASGIPEAVSVDRDEAARQERRGALPDRCRGRS